jgi:hypothetical protein
MVVVSFVMLIRPRLPQGGRGVMPPTGLCGHVKRERESDVPPVR